MFGGPEIKDLLRDLKQLRQEIGILKLSLYGVLFALIVIVGACAYVFDSRIDSLSTKLNRVEATSVNNKTNIRVINDRNRQQEKKSNEQGEEQPNRTK